MKLQVSLRFLVLVLALNGMPADPVRAATASGTVQDSAGHPLAGALVLVYSAGVRKGYSVFCPTCYVDCGKRTTTDEQGNFSIAGLDDELVFNVIAIHEGFVPAWIHNLDPQKSKAAPVTMTARMVRSNLVRSVSTRRGDRRRLQCSSR